MAILIGMLPAGPVAIVCGSGIALDALLDRVEETVSFSAAGLPGSTVPGHASNFMLGYCVDRPIILQRGRLHLYEGHRPAQIAQTVDVLAGFGARTVIFTNACGGLADGCVAGSLCAVEEVRTWPTRGVELPGSFSLDLMLPGCTLRGAYHWVSGPCYETPAEIALLRASGASVVGMSTAIESSRACASGLRTAIVSVITNVCGASDPLTHEHVLEAAKGASGRLRHLLRSALCGVEKC